MGAAWVLVGTGTASEDRTPLLDEEGWPKAGVVAALSKLTHYQTSHGLGKGAQNGYAVASHTVLSAGGQA
jgi:hypothetical protein